MPAAGFIQANRLGWGEHHGDTYGAMWRLVLTLFRGRHDLSKGLLPQAFGFVVRPNHERSIREAERAFAGEGVHAVGTDPGAGRDGEDTRTPSVVTDSGGEFRRPIALGASGNGKGVGRREKFHGSPLVKADDEDEFTFSESNPQVWIPFWEDFGWREDPDLFVRRASARFASKPVCGREDGELREDTLFIPLQLFDSILSVASQPNTTFGEGGFQASEKPSNL